MGTERKQIIDFHLNYGSGLYGPELTGPDFALLMDKHELTGAVLCPLKPHEYHFRSANRAVFDAVNGASQQVWGFCRVDPWRGREAVKEIERCRLEYGFKGVWLHPAEENYAANSVIVNPVIETAAGLGMVIMIAGGFTPQSHPSSLYALACRFPEVEMIITSAGQINISGALLSDAEQLFRDHERLYLETSGIYRSDFIEDMVRKIGPERVLFGSNAPIYSLPFELRRIETLQIADSEKDLLLAGNAYRLLDT
ncbi:MAG: amidohydrolase family protein [bacterium]|jgi:hypothetical protein|nr:amidohydrolase family protein [bacterium]